jgi:hypothetical protein
LTDRRERAECCGALAVGIYEIIHSIWRGSQILRAVDVVELVHKNKFSSLMKLAASHEKLIAICIIHQYVKEDPVFTDLMNGIIFVEGIEL